VTSPATRLALFSRSINNDDVLSAIAIPTLAIHGSQDQIVLQASSQYIVSKVPGARLEVLEGASHCSFADQPVRFNNILADFANSVFDRSLDLVKETA
jgi:pimeloyl-ACP methyl ester carboxylesterase